MTATIAVGASPSAGFDAYVKVNPEFDVARLMRRTTLVLSEAEAEAYSAPFPDARYNAHHQPLSGARMDNQFSTHPSTENRRFSRYSRSSSGRQTKCN
jgi:hypothetical protein